MDNNMIDTHAYMIYLPHCGGSWRPGTPIKEFPQEEKNTGIQNSKRKYQPRLLNRSLKTGIILLFGGIIILLCWICRDSIL